MKAVVGMQLERDNVDAPEDDRLVVKWLENHPKSTQKTIALERLESLLSNAAQPRYASGNACIKLCYFIDQCRTSKDARLQDLAFSEKTALMLFNFYLEWNEKNQHRSMRQVLELLSLLVCHNPDENCSDAVTKAILQKVLSIIAHQSSQPLVKPAFKLLEYFLGKDTISTKALINCYEDQNTDDLDMSSDRDLLWDFFISEVFAWLAWPDVSPAAGKFLVTLFVKLRYEAAGSLLHTVNHISMWQRWIRNGLSKNPETLENVKYYLFPPLFKLDRPGSILFLGGLSSEGLFSGSQIEESKAQSLLQLAAIEVGKKSGLVEEPSPLQSQKDPKKSSIVLDEPTIGDLLTHTLDTIRSLAFSVLVSSSSSTRPFSRLVLSLLQTHMGLLYADTSAKFRNEILSNSRHMIERLRGALAYLTRELENAKFLLDLDVSNGSAAPDKNQEYLDEINGLLKAHKGFTQWYIKFLYDELIPTASYQRHITALKTIILLLRSGISKTDSSLRLPKVSDSATTWPFTIKFFTSAIMRLILDLLMDPFEDVRLSAAIVLRFAPSDDFGPAKPADPVAAFDYNGSQEDSVQTMTLLPLRLSLSLYPTSSSLARYRSAAPQILLDFIDRAQDAARRTGRADYADGVARSFEILYSLSVSTEARLQIIEDLIIQLELRVEMAENDLAQAVLKAPIHSSFAALSLILDAVDHSSGLDNAIVQHSVEDRWSNLQFRMLDSCVRVWRIVRDILCNDSPEGYLPSDIREVERVDTKEVLSYSFRAVHESSNLMNSLISKIKNYWADGTSLLPTEIFARIGWLTFEQLSSLRHRGAFSTVSLTFLRCCQLTQHRTVNFASNQILLEQWYQAALRCISEQVSTTRRSAGIPALITGILTSNAQSPAFQNVVDELKDLARNHVRSSQYDKTNVSQVHSMNCLKEIFSSSSLGKRAESHLVECFQIAADSLESDIWAIRNCGLLLMRSLIDTLFGTNESKESAEAGWDGRSVKLSYEAYPALPALLLKLLDGESDCPERSSSTKIRAVESIFPALDIVRRAGPPSTYRKDIFSSVFNHLGSKVWHIREIAARTICTLLLHRYWLPSVLKLMKTTTRSTNHHHGVLMAVKFVLERRLILNPDSAIDGLDELAPLLPMSKTWSFIDSGCPELLAAHLEVSNSIAKILLSSRHSYATSEQLKLPSIINHLFVQDAFEEFLILMKTYPSVIASIQGIPRTPNIAIACNAVVRRSVFTSALRKDITGLRNVVCFAASLEIEIALAAIDVVPDAWRSYASVDSLFGLVKTYMGAIEMTQSPEVRAAAIFSLAEIVDRLYGHMDSKIVGQGHGDGSAKVPTLPSLEFNEMVRNEINGLGALLQDGIAKTPSLSNAEIRISGSLLVCEYVSLKHFNRTLSSYKSRMEAWAKLLVRAGRSHNDFETRQVAAAALSSFFSNPYLEWYNPNDECVLSSIFALYDTLNDDDDEIRDLSAATVSSLLRKSLVPLAARVELAKHIGNMHIRARSLGWEVVCRLTGSKLETADNVRFRLRPIGVQFLGAMRDDDSLFVEEEQNLFIDEVREAKLWSKVFEDAALDPGRSEGAYFGTEATWSQPHTVLAAWVMDGLLAGCTLLDKDDGPLGWTSKPAIFALWTKLLLSANAIIRHHERLVTSAKGRPVPGYRIIGGIIFALEQLKTLGKGRNFHESLLTEAHGKPLLPLTNLQ